MFLLATNKYNQFLEPFLKTVNEFFFVGEEVQVHLFIDDLSYKFDISERLKVEKYQIEALKFPYATLYRYTMFSQIKEQLNCDYVFYSDVDMAFVDFVDKEILPLDSSEKLVAVRHCGFYMGGGAWGCDGKSTSFTASDKRVKYYAGGFQGGETKAYLAACEIMKNNIKEDSGKGVMAEWHDETHFNKYLSDRLGSFKELTPDYCMVEEVEKRKQWGVNKFKPKLIALKKNHAELRS